MPNAPIAKVVSRTLGPDVSRNLDKIFSRAGIVQFEFRQMDPRLGILDNNVCICDTYCEEGVNTTTLSSGGNNSSI